MLDEKSKKSIMEIISEMVREGESEEKIRGTLKSLGVKEEEINRLLLVAQAHTFELLKSEIDRIVESHVSDKKPALKELLKTQVTQAAEEKMPLPKPEEKAAIAPEKIKSKSNFFSDIISKIFPKKKEPEKPKEEKFFTPETATWQEAAPATAQEAKVAMEEKYSFSKADLKRLRSLKSWHTRYKKKLDYLKQMQRKSKLSEKQITKKVELKTKIRAYSLKIGELKRRIPKEFLRKLKKRKISTKVLPEYIEPAPRDAALELKTMQDLSEAAKAITLAAERIVRTAPRPKIVISGNEEFLTIDQEIEKTKHLKKMLEIDFYKRRITLQDFQTKMMEYQSKLYELEEKKRILEKSKELGEKRTEKSEKVPASIEKALSEKLEGRMNEEKMLEIENYATELLRRYNIPKGEIEKEIKTSDMNTLLADLEKMATINQLELQAKQAIEASQKQAVGGRGRGGPQITIIGGGTPYQQVPRETPGIIGAQQGIPETMQAGMQQAPQNIQPQATQQQPQTIVPATQAGTTGATATPTVAKETAGAQAQPVKQPRGGISFFPPFFWPRQQAQAQQPVQEGQVISGEGNLGATIMPQQQPQEEKIMERGPAIAGEKIAREEAPPELAAREREPEKVVLKTMQEKKYIRAPPSEIKKVMVEPEKSWSEAEIPSFPETFEKGEREKVKTIVKEISKYRIITDLDRVLQTIKEKGIIGIEQLNKETGIEKQRLQELIEILEEHKLAKLEYSTFGEEKIQDINYIKPKPQQAQKQQSGQKGKKPGLFSGFGKKQDQ